MLLYGFSAGVDRSFFFFFFLLLAGCLPGLGSPDLEVPIWDLGIGRTASWLL
jgi:hypothetical protein